MNGSSALVATMAAAMNNEDFAQGLDVVLCPPYPYLAAMQQAINNASLYLGAQNISQQANGAYTGEISASMLQEFGVKYVIIGHSERRSYYGEDNALVAAKVEAAIASGLTPILCVGESEQEREQNLTEKVLTAQLEPVVDCLGIEKFESVVIAYEPVWAIGTGKTASPEMAQQTHSFIRCYLSKFSAEVATKVPLIYGGSVNASNCEQLFAQADIDGGLIGGASLKAEDFSIICTAAKGKI
jgi:triosephosphate isomerase